MKYIPVCAFSFKKSYYLRHPIKFLHEVVKAIRNLFHRMKYGFAWVDLWNMDSYLGTLIPMMLRTLAEKSCAYPGTKDFSTPEVYAAWLRALATIIEQANTEWIYEDEEYLKARKCVEEIQGEEFPVVGNLKNAAKEALKDKSGWSDKLAVVGFTELGKYYHILWD